MSLTGLDDLNRNVHLVRQRGVEGMRAGVDQAAGLVVARMKSLAPKRTGRLAASIQSSRGAAGKYAAMRGGSARAANPDTVFITAGDAAARHAHLAEFGVRRHSLAKGARSKQNFRQNRTPIHPGAQSRPFFFVGFRAERKRALAVIRAETRRQVLAGLPKAR